MPSVVQSSWGSSRDLWAGCNTAECTRRTGTSVRRRGMGVGVTSSVMRCPQRLLITGHRPVLDALLGSPHTHRRDDAGARRFGAQRKVRYIGFSDTPAWKVVEAQMLARFHGWAPVAAIQISYSLAERTVEGDLIPMAREFGIGVTPWSPLAGAVLTGKYTRQNASTVTAARGERVTSALTERNYAIVDELIRVAREVNSTPAAVALAWVQTRPGVTSTIIGARRLDQLDQNLGGARRHTRRRSCRGFKPGLEARSEFPCRLSRVRPVVHAGLARPSTESRRKCRRSCRSRTRSGTEGGTGRMSSTAPT